MKKLLLSLFSLVFITNFTLQPALPINDVFGNNDSVSKKDLLLEKIIEQNNLLIQQIINQTSQKEVAKPVPTPQGRKSIVSKILSKTFGGALGTVKFVIDKSDKIVSKKGLIAVLLLSALPVYLYHNHINDKTLPKIFYSISNKIGQGMAVAGGAAAKGAINGVVTEVIKDHKITAAKAIGTGIGIGTLLKFIDKASDKLCLACISLLPFVLKLGSKFYLLKFSHPNLSATIGTQTNFEIPSYIY